MFVSGEVGLAQLALLLVQQANHHAALVQVAHLEKQVVITYAVFFSRRLSVGFLARSAADQSHRIAGLQDQPCLECGDVCRAQAFLADRDGRDDGERFFLKKIIHTHLN